MDLLLKDPHSGDYKPKMPSILIGTPSGDTILARTAKFIFGLCGHLMTVGVQPIWGTAEGTYVHVNQNILAMQVLELNADALLLIDSDMTGSPAIAERLYAHLRAGKDIIGCDYRCRQPELQFCMAGRNLQGDRAKGTETGVEEYKFLPTGCLMIRRRVLEKVKFPWFFNTDGEKPADFVGNDANFCFKAHAAGFRIWCDHDLSNELQHNGMLPLPRQPR